MKFRVPFAGHAQRTAVLKVAWPDDPDVEFLVDEDSSPVWPITSESETDGVKRAASLFGGTVEEVAPRPGFPAAEGSETVVGLGAGEDEAALYAHLTGRRSQSIDSLDEIGQGEMPAVFICCGSELPRDLLQFLMMTPYGRRAPGIVWGRTPAELRRQVLTASCAARVTGPGSPSHLFVLGQDLGLSSVARSLTALRKALSDDLGVLVLHSHSYGICQDIGLEAALCGRIEAGEADPERAPECVYSGTCFVLGRKVDEAAKSAALISPGLISARILVDTGCHSAFLGSRAVDPSWSALRGLVLNPTVGALVASPDLSMNAISSIHEELFRALTAGESVGTAIVRYEEDPFLANLGQRLVLFGDPDVCGGSDAGLTVVKRNEQSSSVRISPSSVNLPKLSASPATRDLALLRSLSFVIKNETRDRAEQTSAEVRGLIAQMEGAEDPEAAIVGDLGRELRTSVLRHLLTTKVRLHDAWQLEWSQERGSGLAQCPHCGWCVRPRTAFDLNGCKRESLSCSYCNDVWDIPVPPEVNLSLEGMQATLEGDVSPGTWAAALYVVYTEPQRNAMAYWPATDDGRPVPIHVLSSDMHPNRPARLYAVCLVGLAIHAAAIPLPSKAIAGR